MLTIPPFGYFNRLIIIVIGIVVLVWSGVEDNQVWGVVILAWFISPILILNVLMSRFGNQSFASTHAIRYGLLVGLSMGAFANILSIMLMLFKNIRHAHVFPDYPPQLMIDMLTRLPIWALAGLFLCTGILFLWLTFLPATLESDKDSRHISAD